MRILTQILRFFSRLGSRAPAAHNDNLRANEFDDQSGPVISPWLSTLER